jgi:hypothetical protein
VANSSSSEEEEEEEEEEAMEEGIISVCVCVFIIMCVTNNVMMGRGMIKTHTNVKEDLEEEEEAIRR